MTEDAESAKQGQGQADPPSFSRFVAALLCIAAPVAAYQITTKMVHGEASIRYFEAVAQLIPILLLTLAVERRYFFREPLTKADLPTHVRSPGLRLMLRAMPIAAYGYVLLVLAYLTLGEVSALRAIATEGSTSTDLDVTAGCLAAGVTALLITGLQGVASRTRERSAA